VWVFALDGQSFTSDDFTFAEVESIEAVTGSPWSTLNPLRSAAVARGFLATALIRSGMSDDDAKARIDALTVKDMKRMFTFTPEDDRPQEYRDGLPVVDPKAVTAGSPTS
jgi:hypothetical protein